MPFPNDAETTAYIQSYFKRKKVPYQEESLIDVLDDSAMGKMAVYWAVLALRDVGTATCVPALKRKLRYPMRDVKDCSILTIAHIAGATETEFYVEALRDKRTQKACPLWAILDAADERAIEAVLEYADKEIRALKTNRPNAGLIFAVQYLRKNLEKDDRVEKALHSLQDRGFRIPEQSNAGLAFSGLTESPP
jgi:hypothetical protein